MKLRFSPTLITIHAHGLGFCLDGQCPSYSVERSRRKLSLIVSYKRGRVAGLCLSSNANGKNNGSSDAMTDAHTNSGNHSAHDFSNDLENSESGGDLGGICDPSEVEIEVTGKNRRRIQSRILVKAGLQRVWNILTDYERLADFIPGLAVSQLLEKRDNFARLFQIGQQNLAFGLKFEAKGVIECYEGDLENTPFGQRRDISFKMVKGDFQLFEGTWSIEQTNTKESEQNDLISDQEFCTTLSYVVDVEPKVWLPVRLVQGRLSREIEMNLLSIKEAAESKT